MTRMLEVLESISATRRSGRRPLVGTATDAFTLGVAGSARRSVTARSMMGEIKNGLELVTVTYDQRTL